MRMFVLSLKIFVLLAILAISPSFANPPKSAAAGIESKSGSKAQGALSFSQRATATRQGTISLKPNPLPSHS